MPLLYDTSRGMYDRWAGNRENAFRILRRTFRGSGTDTAVTRSAWIAEIDGESVGVMAAFPGPEQGRRGRNIVLPDAGGHAAMDLAAARSGMYRRGQALPDPPGREHAFYVDALATHRTCAGAASRAPSSTRQRARPGASASTACSSTPPSTTRTRSAPTSAPASRCSTAAAASGSRARGRSTRPVIKRRAGRR